MAAVFRTLISSQEPVKPQQKRSSPADNASPEKEEHSSSPPHSGKKLNNIFRLRKNMKNKKNPDRPRPDISGLEVTREPSTDNPSTEPPMYFNHSRPTLQAREANKRGNRDSYLPMLRSLARNAPTPDRNEDDGDIREITDPPEDIMSPRSYFEDSSDDEDSTATPMSGRMLKKPIANLKVSTSNLFARSRAPAGGSGSGSAEPGSSFALGISGIDLGLTPVSPVISNPTGFRRLDGGREWDSIRAVRSATSPALEQSRRYYLSTPHGPVRLTTSSPVLPSTRSSATGTSQKGKLGKMPSTRDLSNWFWGRSQDQIASPTRLHPRDATESVSSCLRGQPPAFLARVQRRQAAALPAIAERPASPALQSADAAEEDDEIISESSSFYLEDAEVDAIPAPLQVVKKEGNPSSLRRVEKDREHRRRVRQSRSHPALRSQAAPGQGLARSASGPVNVGMLLQPQEEIPPVPPLPSTAPLPQRPFTPWRPSLELAVHNFFFPAEPYVSPEIGLERFAKPRRDEAKHPNHGLKWETESLMCFGKHSPSDLLTTADTATGFAPEGEKTDMRGITITKSAFSSAAKLDDETIAEAKQCPFCSRYCCHYIELLAFLRSAPTPTTSSPHHADVGDERNRIHASATVAKLKQERPNGIDAFETFVECEECGREVCKDCAGRCAEELCRSVRCVGCSGGCGHEG